MLATRNTSVFVEQTLRGLILLFYILCIITVPLLLFHIANLPDVVNILTIALFIHLLISVIYIIVSIGMFVYIWTQELEQREQYLSSANRRFTI